MGSEAGGHGCSLSVLSMERVCRELKIALLRAPDRAKVTVIDLGSGLGRFVAAVAQTLQAECVRVVGVEVAADRVALSRLFLSKILAPAETVPLEGGSTEFFRGPSFPSVVLLRGDFSVVVQGAVPDMSSTVARATPSVLLHFVGVSSASSLSADLFRELAEEGACGGVGSPRVVATTDGVVQRLLSGSPFFKRGSRVRVEMHESGDLFEMSFFVRSK